LQFNILRFDSIDSTNLEAMRRAKAGAPEGLCIIAREQTRGRGRQERVWISPRDAGLYFTVVLRPRLAVATWPLITLMAALAVSDSLREACELQTDIKWPNDIVIVDRKLCGILAETVETDQGLACVLGIGINLTDDAFPAELREHATSLKSQSARITNAETMLQSLLEQLSVRYAQLLNHGGEAKILHDWSAASSFANGKQVRVDTGAEVFAGTTRGLESDGGLRVETETGEVRIVRAGDVQSLRAGG